MYKNIGGLHTSHKIQISERKYFDMLNIKKLNTFLYRKIELQKQSQMINSNLKICFYHP